MSGQPPVLPRRVRMLIGIPTLLGIVLVMLGAVLNFYGWWIAETILFGIAAVSFSVTIAAYRRYGHASYAEQLEQERIRGMSRGRWIGVFVSLALVAWAVWFFLSR